MENIMQPKKVEGGQIPKGRAWLALVISLSVAIAALFYGLWLVRPQMLLRLAGY